MQYFLSEEEIEACHAAENETDADNKFTEVLTKIKGEN